jgi:hypothetical protein
VKEARNGSRRSTSQLEKARFADRCDPAQRAEGTESTEVNVEAQVFYRLRCAIRAEGYPPCRVLQRRCRASISHRIETCFPTVYAPSHVTIAPSSSSSTTVNASSPASSVLCSAACTHLCLALCQSCTSRREQSPTGINKHRRLCGNLGGDSD